MKLQWIAVAFAVIGIGFTAFAQAPTRAFGQPVQAPQAQEESGAPVTVSFQTCGTEALDTSELLDPSGFPAFAREFRPLKLHTARVLVEFTDLRPADTENPSPMIPPDLPYRWSSSKVEAQRFLWQHAITGSRQPYRLLTFDPPLDLCIFLMGYDEWHAAHVKLAADAAFGQMRLIFERAGELAVLDDNVTVWLENGADPEKVSLSLIAYLDSAGLSATKPRNTDSFRIEPGSGDLRITLTANAGTSPIRLAVKLAGMSRWVSRVRLNFFPLESAIRTATRLDRMKIDGSSYRFSDDETPLGQPYEKGWMWMADVDLSRDGFWGERNLGEGSCGPDVEALQEFLLRRKSGPAASALSRARDPCFKRHTQKALTEYQKAQGLPATGLLGPDTRAFMRRNAEPFYKMLSSAQDTTGELKKGVHAKDGTPEVIMVEPGCVQESVRGPSLRFNRIRIACRFTIPDAGDYTIQPISLRFENAETGVPFEVATEREVKFKVVEFPKDGQIAFLPPPDVRVQAKRTKPSANIAPVPKDDSVSGIVAEATETVVDASVARIGAAANFAKACAFDAVPCLQAFRHNHPSVISQALMVAAGALALLLVFWRRVGPYPPLAVMVGRRVRRAWRSGADWMWTIPRLIDQNPARGWRVVLERASGRDIGSQSAEWIAEKFGVALPFDVDALLQRESAVDSPVARIIFLLAILEHEAQPAPLEVERLMASHARFEAAYGGRAGMVRLYRAIRKEQKGYRSLRMRLAAFVKKILNLFSWRRK